MTAIRGYKLSGLILAAGLAALMGVSGCETNYAGEIVAPLLFESAAEDSSILDMYQEPNDSIPLAIPFPTDGNPYTYTFHRTSDIDFFVFSKAYGASYSVEVKTVDEGVGAEVLVMDETGMRIAGSIVGGNRIGGASLELGEYLNNGSTLYLRTRSVGTEVGKYTVRISVAADTYENDGSVATADSISITGESQVRTLHSDADEDYIRFSVIKDFNYLVRVKTFLDPQPILITVLDASHNTVKSNGQTDLGPDVTFVAQYTGYYYVRIMPDRTAALGTYEVAVVVQDDPYEPDDAIQIENVSPTVIRTDGTEQSHSFSARERLSDADPDEDYIMFHAKNGHPYDITITEKSPNVQIELYIYRKSGVSLGDLGEGEYWVYRTEFDTTGTEVDDTFYLRIKNKSVTTEGDFTACGTYTIKVEDASNATN